MNRLSPLLVTAGLLVAGCNGATPDDEPGHGDSAPGDSLSGDDGAPAVCDLALSESFDGSLPPFAGDAAWSATTSTNSDLGFVWSDEAVHNLDGGFALAYTDGTSASWKGAVATLTTSTIHSAGCATVGLTFVADIQSMGLGGSGQGPGMIADVLVESSGKVAQVAGQWFDQAGPAPAVLDLTAFVPVDADFTVTFRVTQQEMLEIWWAIDDVELTGE